METIKLTPQQTAQLREVSADDEAGSLYVPLTDISQGRIITVNDVSKLPNGFIVVCGSGPSILNPDPLVLTPVVAVIDLDSDFIFLYRRFIDDPEMSGSAVKLCIVPNVSETYSYVMYLTYNLAIGDGPLFPYLGIIPSGVHGEEFVKLPLGDYTAIAEAIAINVSTTQGYTIAGLGMSAASETVPVLWQGTFDINNLFNPVLNIKPLTLPSGYSSGEVTCGNFASGTLLGGNVTGSGVTSGVVWVIQNDTITSILVDVLGSALLNISPNGRFACGYFYRGGIPPYSRVWVKVGDEYLQYLSGSGSNYATLVANRGQFIGETENAPNSSPNFYDPDTTPDYLSLYEYLVKIGVPDMPANNTNGFTTKNISPDQTVLVGNRISTAHPNGEAWMVTNPF